MKKTNIYFGLAQGNAYLITHFYGIDSHVSPMLVWNSSLVCLIIPQLLILILGLTLEGC